MTARAQLHQLRRATDFAAGHPFLTDTERRRLFVAIRVELRLVLEDFRAGRLAR